MAHTPGPWVVRAPDADELHEIYAEGTGELICYPVWTHNQRANIPLIAAAPELLAALRLARDDLSDLLEAADLTDEGAAGTTHVLNSVIAAIAKAEGRGDEQ